MRVTTLIATVFAVLSVFSTAWAEFDQQHPELTKALAANVVYKDAASEVNYVGLQRHPSDLILYLKLIGRVPEKIFKTWTPDQQTAFLINAFNANALQIVKDNFPVTSIQKIQGPGGFWKMKFVRLFGREYSLDSLKQLLRKEHNDPRIVFALSSASVGSPRLRNEAYVASALNEQLDDQVKTFLRSPTANRIDTAKKVAQISKVFNELSDDFTKSGTTVTKFIAPYVSDDVKVRAELEGGLYAVEYLDPDMNLNKLSK